MLIGCVALSLVLVGVGLARLLPSRQGQKIDQTQNKEKENQKEVPKFVAPFDGKTLDGWDHAASKIINSGRHATGD